VPNRIITDVGSQFTSGVFKAYCISLGTKIFYASVAHPRNNGQVERANVEVLKGWKMKMFDQFKGSTKNWIEELPTVLWSLHTTASRATEETPFPLVYGAEAMMPLSCNMAPPSGASFQR
jgi:hypothetical protein